MYPAIDDNVPERVDLCDVIGGIGAELRCLLGPAIHAHIGSLPTGSSAHVSVGQAQIVDLLRHLALDAHDAMPTGGTISIRTGRLGEVPQCAAIVIHEVPAAPATARARAERIRKGRSLGLGASFDAIERAGGHLHVSCRAGETVLTICFPLAA
jgi:hypothetical protein